LLWQMPPRRAVAHTRSAEDIARDEAWAEERWTMFDTVGRLTEMLQQQAG